MHYINAPHVHRDADTRIKYTRSHFQEVKSTSVRPATGGGGVDHSGCCEVTCLPVLRSARCGRLHSTAVTQLQRGRASRAEPENGPRPQEETAPAFAYSFINL